MPIRINLLTEALAEEDLRRRDPVKRVIFIGLLLVVLALVWFSSTWLEYKLLQKNFSQVENEIRSHTNDYSLVQASQKQLSDGQRRLNALQQLNTNRFLQGNLLNALQHIYVPSVQLTRLKLDQKYTFNEGSAAQTNTSKMVLGRPGSSIERITLTLDAKDASPNPGDQVNPYKDALTKLDYLNSTPDKTNDVRLVSAPQSAVSVEGKPFVQFTLEYHFPDKTR
jgi:TolA-binding protein